MVLYIKYYDIIPHKDSCFYIDMGRLQIHGGFKGSASIMMYKHEEYAVRIPMPLYSPSERYSPSQKTQSL